MNDQNSNTNETSLLERELDSLRAIKFVNENIYKIYTYDIPVPRLASIIKQALGTTHTVLMTINDDNAHLEFNGASPTIPDAALASDDEAPYITINTFNADSYSPVAKLAGGAFVTLAPDAAAPRLEMLRQRLGKHHYALMPLILGDKLIGLVVVYNDDDTPVSDNKVETLKTIAPTLASALVQAQRIQKLEADLATTKREREIFQRIDEELADIIELDYVFRMTMDWALRFTNADAAALSLYDSEEDTIRIMAHYGHRDNALPLDTPLQARESGITMRVARSGKPEIVPDVSLDKDYYLVADGIRTQMTAPIKREEQVIAVISLESRKLNGFSEDNLDFVRKLTARAGVAVDNARLFTETNREREKLQQILKNIADIVILVGNDNRILLMNYSAMLALRLSIADDYSGRPFVDVIDHSVLQNLYRDALEAGEDSVSEEVELPNGRTYHARIDFHPGIGRIIVMQDITHFKETDKLKTELVATVSHDLKQPLSVMRGYLDLLRMTNTFDERSARYIENLEYAFKNMRQLIDDLLDIAHIEAGLELDEEPVDVAHVLRRSVSLNKPNADKKMQVLSVDIPESLPHVRGDEFRLQQVFTNLISNAIKYTPPEGEIKVSCEYKQDSVRIFFADNGMGIGPEDQSQIFERFYRVRRPETDSIDGTGLGLAIVRSLIEAHRGKIDVKSELGNGSTFRIVLPAVQ